MIANISKQITLPTEFAILGLGSFSRGAMMLSSDFDLALLLRNPTFKTHYAIQPFLQVLQLTVEQLGETAVDTDLMLGGTQGFCIDKGDFGDVFASQVATTSYF